MERWAVVVAVDLLSPPPIVSGVEPQAATEGGTSTVPGERQAITVGKQVPVPYFTWVPVLGTHRLSTMTPQSGGHVLRKVPPHVIQLDASDLPGI